MTKNPKIAENSERLLEQLANLSESELSDLVLLHNQRYFQENNPEITDEAFDKLVEALRFINPRALALAQIGHRESAGSKTNFGDEVIHLQPMLSLDKCYDETTFFKWAEKIVGDFVAMPKIDGVACSIIYSGKGELVEASTRGDGRTGENITKNAVLISDLPSMLSRKVVESAIKEENYLEVRGEVFFPLSRFNESFAEDFSNPRNLAAGVLKLKESDPTKNNILKFFPYDIRGSRANNEQNKFLLLEQLGFSMMPWSIVKNDASATEIYFEFLKKRASFDYEIDGVVYRANLASDQARLGETAHHPKFALAFKFHGESAPTRLIGVEWSVARSGVVTPIAVVEPVFVSGASVSRASLHNLGIFLQHDLRENTLVEINRRGGVIPHLERVLSRKGAALPVPERCPSCGGPLIIDGDFLRCQNPQDCEEVVVSKLLHFCHVLGLEGLGEKIVRKLFREGMLKRFGDVFRLKAEGLASLDRMGNVLANKLVDEINRKREISLATFIKALGISEIGSNISELIAANFHTLSRIRALSPEDLLPIYGVGERIATSLVEGLMDDGAEIEDLLTEVKVKDEETMTEELDTSHPLFDKSVIFTGKMAHLDRKSAQNAVKKIGGKAPGAMSSAIDFLVIGDEGSPLLGEGKKSTKQKVAEKLKAEGSSINIISESEFLKLLGKQI